MDDDLTSFKWSKKIHTSAYENSLEHVQFKHVDFNK